MPTRNAIVNLTQPDQSRMVLKVAGGHNCWLSSNAGLRRHPDHLDPQLGRRGRRRRHADPAAGAGRRIDVGDEQDLPAIGNDAGTNGQSCHHDLAAGARCAATACAAMRPPRRTPQSPFFASADVNEAYAAARSKIDLDNPANSRLVVRLRDESHNCWTTSCANDADAMQARIQQFVDGIQSDAGRPGPGDQQGADPVRRHGGRRRQPLSTRIPSPSTSSRPARAARCSTPAASSRR